MASLPALKTSQPQPEPNCLAVVSLKSFLKAFEIAEVSLDLRRDGAGRIAAALRLHDLPEHGVVHMAATVVLHHLAHILRDGGKVL